MSLVEDKTYYDNINLAIIEKNNYSVLAPRLANILVHCMNESVSDLRQGKSLWSEVKEISFFFFWLWAIQMLR